MLRRPFHRAGARSRDRGQVAVEYVGLLPILIIVALCAVQLGLAVYAVQQAGTASRAAARAAAQNNHTIDYRSAGEAAVSDWLTARVDPPKVTYDSVEVTVHVDIPSVVPGVGFGSAERSVTMPRD